MNHASYITNMNLPGDIIRIIFDFDGRWRMENGKWISVFHEKDKRYRNLHYLFQWRKYNEYICEGYNAYNQSFSYCITHIFPIINHVEHRNYIRFLHIKKIIVYGKNEYGKNEYGKEKKVKYSKHNIIRAFTTRIGCNIDMSDSYHIDDYFDYGDDENDYCFGEYIE